MLLYTTDTWPVKNREPDKYRSAVFIQNNTQDGKYYMYTPESATICVN